MDNSETHDDIELAFKKVELKRKQLENRKFEAEIRLIELDVELKEKIQPFEVSKVESEALKQQALAQRASSRSNWLMAWVVFLTGVVTWFDKAVEAIKRIFNF